VRPINGIQLVKAPQPPSGIGTRDWNFSHKPTGPGKSVRCPGTGTGSGSKVSRLLEVWWLTPPGSPQTATGFLWMAHCYNAPKHSVPSLNRGHGGWTRTTEKTGKTEIKRRVRPSRASSVWLCSTPFFLIPSPKRIITRPVLYKLVPGPSI